MRLIDKDALAARLEDECKKWEGESAYQAGLCAAAVLVAEAPIVKQESTIGGWISVNEKLPEEDIDVLVANGLGVEIAAYTTNPIKQWYGMSGQTVYVNYWMPLPEPPEEE